MGNKSSSANITSDSEHELSSNKTPNNNNNNNVNQNAKEKTSRVLFFLHRTWAIILTSRSRSRISPRTDNSDTISDFTSQYSQYSFCSCSQCQRDDGFSSGCFSDFFDTGSSMAPNSEEASKNQLPCFEEVTSKEKQRPPIYNPEDYAIMLKKWGRKSAGSSNMGMVSLYATSSISDIECSRPSSHSFRDYRNPMLTSSGSEMTLRQFGTVSELLAKLKCDLRLAYPSFIQEFVADPLDGVTLLLDLLRAIQLSQSNNMAAQPGSSNTTGKMPPALQRRALLDELSCLQCLLSCCVRYTESVRKLTASSAGLFTLAICIMSNVNKSRIIALQLLSKACEPEIGGHTAISEAMSTLRLRFGEPVRFRFLVGMLTSAGGQKELVTSGMKFLNRFLDSAGSMQKKLYIQAELEQAGLDAESIKKNIGSGNGSEHAIEELEYWEENIINVESLKKRLSDVEKENQTMKDKLTIMERKVQILQEEKGILVSLEQCLKEKCTELQSEVRSLKSDKNSKDICSIKVADPATNEDEGISSSERSLTPDEIRKSHIYDSFKYQNQTPSLKIEDPNEEETTIDEVIEELQNIINDVESEDYAKEQLLLKKQQEERRKIEEAQVNGKLQLQKIELDDYIISTTGNDNEIIPSNLHPQPPRKTKSLVHLFMPTDDYYYCNNNKELFFENETPYTSEEGSDSLLSSSKCHNKNILPYNNNNNNVIVSSPTPNCNNVITVTCTDKKQPTENKSSRTYDRNIKRKTSSKAESSSRQRLEQKNSFDSSYYYNTPVNDFIHTNRKDSRLHSISGRLHDQPRCKSLERINGGLDSMIDIVMTNQNIASSFQVRTKSDSGNVSGTTLSRSVSNVFCHGKVSNKDRRLSTHSEEKQRMFLPVNGNNVNVKNSANDIPYYFPRIQEKRANNTNFLIKRGHGNAGMYSGQVVMNNDGTSNNVTNINFMKTREFVLNNGSKVCGKVTDLASGLY